MAKTMNHIEAVGYDKCILTAAKLAWSMVMLALVLSLSLFCASVALADDAIFYWVKRIQQASAQQSYFGEIQYYRASQPIRRMEFTHLGNGDYSHEHLSGPYQGAVEVVRSDKGVTVYSINQKQDVQNIQLLNQPSLQWLSDSQARVVADNYSFIKGPIVTVAGRKTRQVTFKPNKEDRHEFRAWIDEKTGILMGSSRRNELGDVVESFYFTRIKVGDAARQQVKDYFDFMALDQDKNIVSKNRYKLSQPSQMLKLNYLPDGFTEITELRRELPAPLLANQWIYSDGLNTVSIFVRKLNKPKKEAVFAERRLVGSIAVKHSGYYELTVIGELPLEVVKKILNGIDVVKKK